MIFTYNLTVNYLSFWIYMLLVGPKTQGYNRRIYTGYTKYLSSRILQHSGISSIKGAKMTRKQPIEFVYAESYPTQKKAMQREKQLKHIHPYNKKDYKLKLIMQFQENNDEFIRSINDKLIEYFKFQKDFIQDLKNLESILSVHLDNV